MPVSVPVLSEWAPPQRRQASLGATVGAVALMLFAVLAVLFGGSQSSLFVTVILAILILVLIFQALVVASAPSDAEAGAYEAPAGGWQAEAPAGAAPLPPPSAAGAQLTLKCSSCATVFDVTDTGERPLRHTCPGCGAAGELTEADIGPAAAPPAPPPVAEAGITLKCSSCGTVFDVTDTGERPLRHACPGCGAEGILREEDIGPAPAAAAPPVPAAPPAPRAKAAPPAPAAPAKTVKTLKLRCKNCQTVFTLRDTGERPLYHECPGCKATGVLR